MSAAVRETVVERRVRFQSRLRMRTARVSREKRHLEGRCVDCVVQMCVLRRVRGDSGHVTERWSMFDVWTTDGFLCGAHLAAGGAAGALALEGHEAHAVGFRHGRQRQHMAAAVCVWSTVCREARRLGVVKLVKQNVS